MLGVQGQFTLGASACGPVALRMKLSATASTPRNRCSRPTEVRGQGATFAGASPALRGVCCLCSERFSGRRWAAACEHLPTAGARLPSGGGCLRGPEVLGESTCFCRTGSAARKTFLFVSEMSPSPPTQSALLFPNAIMTEQRSLMLVKRLLAISVSCITYLRGIFPECAYGSRYLDGNTMLVLKLPLNIVIVIFIWACSKTVIFYLEILLFLITALLLRYNSHI